jgi:hypothetical protein
LVIPDLHTSFLEHLAKRPGVEWIAVKDQAARLPQESTNTVGQVSTDVLDPGLAQLIADAGHLHPPSNDIDDEEHEVSDNTEAAQWVDTGGGLSPATFSGRHVTRILCKRDARRFTTRNAV